MASSRSVQPPREYLKKGRQVYIEGRLKTRKWQDKDTGADRYSTEVVGDQMQMLGGRGGGESEGNEQPSSSSVQQRNPRSAAQQPQSTGASLAEMDDDIPF